MSQLIDIEQRLEQLEGGVFEKLCDAYLSFREKAHVCSLGMKNGTSKTKPGQPDSYIRLPDGKYIFIESTVQKTNFMQKAEGDINICLDQAEKGIGLENLKKIIFCHTYGNLSAEDNQALHQICMKKNVPLELIGLDQLAFDLYNNYPRIVQDFLHISVVPLVRPTPVLYSNRFKYNSDSVSLLGRDAELNALLDFCRDEGQLYWTGICGEGGIGKTRLVYELCKKMEQESWSVYRPQHTKDTLDTIRHQLEKGIAFHMLICFDYVKTQLDRIVKLIRSLAEAYPFHEYKIRIILIERDSSDFPDHTDKVADYQYRFGKEKKPYINNKGLMELCSPKAQISDIMRDYSSRRGCLPDGAAIERMLAVLQSIDPLCERPLYALCIADAWCNGENLYHWDRASALQYIVSKEHHRWKDVIEKELVEGFEQSAYRQTLDCVMLISTLTGGINPEQIAPLIQDKFTLDITKPKSAWLMKKLELLDKQGKIIQIEPDLIGEYFCIDAFKRLDESRVESIFSYVFSPLCFSESVQYFRRLYDDYADIIIDADWLKYIHTITYPQEFSYIKKQLFKNCGYIKEIQLHDRVREIQNGAFCGCANLQKITFPARLETIGINAFKGCKSLIEIDLPSATRTIGYAAFEDCVSLQEVVIPRSVSEIKSSTFAGCSGLTVLDLRAQEVEIGTEALKKCTNLRVVKGAKRITSIAPDAFQSCGSLTTLQFSSLRWIGPRAFSNCTGLQMVDMSFCSLKAVPQRGFYGCTQLETVLLPDSVTRIGREAFCGCKQLTQLDLPSSVRHIESAAFRDCVSLPSLNLQPGIQKIEVQAIANCRALQNLSTIPAAGKAVKLCGFTFSSISMREIAFLSSYGELEEIDLPNTVIEIGDNAFAGHKNLTHIRIPQSVIRIGNCAFTSCSSLTEVNAYGNRIQKIGTNAFRNCLALRSFLGVLNVSVIEDGSFFGCTALEKLIFVGRIDRIGNYAFAYCQNLKNPYFGQPVSKIGVDAFWGCEKFHPVRGLPKFYRSRMQGFTFKKYGAEEFRFMETYSNLEHIRIPDTCISFSIDAFSRNSVIKTLLIPSSIKTLPQKAFYGCTNLETIELPDTIQALPTQVFMNCSSLTHIVFGKWPSNTIPDHVSIGSGAFSGCKSLKELKLPAELKCILKYTFSQCVRLRKVDLPEGLTEIGSYAFQLCGDLQRILLPSTLTSIDFGAFKGCKALYEVNGLERSQVNNINNDAFQECDHLERIQLPNSLRRIGAGSFRGCKKLEHLDLPPRVNIIEMAAFQDCYSLKEMVVPPQVSKIQPYTFKHCSSLEQITFLGSVQAIEEGAFYHCNQLQEFNFPRGITILEKNIWTNCHHLIEISIPSSVQSLSKSGGLFEACYSLKKVRIPPHITEIPANCFKDCTSLEDIKLPDVVRYIGPGAFRNCGLRYLELPESLTDICPSIFSGCKDLTEIFLPSSIQRIPAKAFEDCANLNRVSFHSISEIGEYAFCRCVSLTDIPIKRISKKIDRGAFLGCESLKNVTFSDTISVICPSAFRECSAIEEIVIPPTIKTICGSTFRGNTNLKNVIIPKSVAVIKKSAFRDCIHLEKLTIDSDDITIYSRAFGGCRALYMIDTPICGRVEISREAVIDCPAEKYMIDDKWQWIDV